MDALSRQLAKAESDAEERLREREVLLEDMRAAQQVGDITYGRWIGQGRGVIMSILRGSRPP